MMAAVCILFIDQAAVCSKQFLTPPQLATSIKSVSASAAVFRSRVIPISQKK